MSDFVPSSEHNYKPGELVDIHLHGFGLWPCVIIERDHFVWSTTKVPEELAPRGHVYVLTLGDRQLKRVEPKHVHPSSNTPAHVKGTRLFKKALDEKHCYATRRIKQYALWMFPPYSVPYVAELVSISEDKMILKTEEGGEEEVDPKDWWQIRFIGDAPAVFDAATPLAVPMIRTIQKRKMNVVCPPMTATQAEAFEHMRQKRKSSAERKKRRVAERAKRAKERRDLIYSLFGECSDSDESYE